MKWEDAEKLIYKHDWLFGPEPSYLGATLLVIGIFGCLIVGVICWPFLLIWDRITRR